MHRRASNLLPASSATKAMCLFPCRLTALFRFERDVSNPGSCLGLASSTRGRTLAAFTCGLSAGRTVPLWQEKCANIIKLNKQFNTFAAVCGRQMLPRTVPTLRGLWQRPATLVWKPHSLHADSDCGNMLYFSFGCEVDLSKRIRPIHFDPLVLYKRFSTILLICHRHKFVPSQGTHSSYRCLSADGISWSCAHAGDQFALFESLSALAILLRRFEFRMAPGAPPVGMITVRLFYVFGRLIYFIEAPQ